VQQDGVGLVLDSRDSRLVGLHERLFVFAYWNILEVNPVQRCPLRYTFAVYLGLMCPERADKARAALVEPLGKLALVFEGVFHCVASLHATGIGESVMAHGTPNSLGGFCFGHLARWKTSTYRGAG
jgi:hypothetical protein